MLNLEYFDAAGNAAAAGVFIPQTDLPGILAIELASAATGKESKASLAILSALFAYTSGLSSPILGLTVAKTTPTGAALDTINQNFTASVSYLANHATNTLGQVPLPSSGSNSGLGGLPIDEVFPNAVKVAAAASTGAAGILIPTSELTPYGSPDQASITVYADSRAWFAALLLYMVAEATARTTEAASAVVARTVGSATGQSFPASWIQATNPVSGVAAADVPKRSLLSRSYSMTVQLILDQETQVFDVNHVTA